ncbi:MAG TPA: hypothetical protein DER64_09575 [Planctomycetaceae bacterium]|nr:hypothetical protein [Planctomycetaceae bacterium]
MKSNEPTPAPRMTRDARDPSEPSRCQRGEEMRGYVRFVLAVALFVPPAMAQGKAGKTDRSKSADAIECSVTSGQLDKLNGSPAELVLVNGKRIKDVTIVKFVRGSNKDTVRTVVYLRPKRKTASRLRAGALVRIVAAERAYDLVAVPALKAWMLVDVDEKTKAVSARLKAKGRQVWPKLSAEQQADAVREHKKFLADVRRKFSGLPLRLYETKFFLFLTDMPAAQIGVYIAHLDKMSVELGKRFGVPPGENIWRGKAVFVVFVNQASFVQFETSVMKMPLASTNRKQGICHQNNRNGDVIVACHRGNDPNYFAQVLVHETTHGYLHRFKSSARVPSWLNEGIAEWVSTIVVRSSPAPLKRQAEAVLRLKQTGVVGPSFFGKKIESWHYGIASRITDSMITQNSRAFGAWIVSIKEGVEWSQGLQKTFGVTPQQLLLRYGRSIGVPMIRLQ